MLSGEFERKLRKLNPSLKIWCGDDYSKPAGLFYIRNNEYIEICGVDKNNVPEFTIWDNKGHIVKSGWRRILEILIPRKLIDKHIAERVFNTYFDCPNALPYIEEDYIYKKIKEAQRQDKWHRDDLAEIGSRL